MRYEKGHKDATRRRIVEVTSQQLRKEGVGASGVAALMARAGLTHGGFYSHFSSKDALIEEALRDAIEQVRAWIAAVAQTEENKFEAIVRAYLSPITGTIRRPAAWRRRWLRKSEALPGRPRNVHEEHRRAYRHAREPAACERDT